jgi:lysophospholipase L1-like esterase
VLVLGDAYSSGDGVEPDEAWPAVLARDGANEVLNFAITGYGSDQYAAVAEEFVPRLRPDVVIVQVSFTDLTDALVSIDERRAAIGFDRPDASSWRTRAGLDELRAWIEARVVDPLRERAQGRAQPLGRFLGGFAALERAQRPVMQRGAEQLRDDLDRVRVVATAAAAELIVVWVPPPAAVCDRSDLDYWPAAIDLRDRQWDRRQADDVVARALVGFDTVSVREIAGGCPYHARNLHFRVTGHVRLAEAVRTALAVARPGTKR